MKICMISTENIVTPPTGYWGGIESVTHSLTCELHKMGHEVTLVARPGSKSPGELIETFPDTDSELGVNERHFKAYKDFLEDYDGVVHDHSNGKMAHRVHPRVVNTSHWRQTPQSMSYRNIVAVSEAHAKWYHQYMSKAKTKVVHHGIDADRFKFQKEKEDYHLYFSVMADYKGALEVLRVAEETDIPFIFAGRNGDATEKIKKSELEHRNIFFMGEVSNEERSRLMSEAKALVFPTGAFGKSDWLEVFGLVQLEALASGTPVIASDNGACPEVVEHGQTGFVCPDYESMKQVIKNNSVSKINPETCRGQVEKYFSTERMAREYVELYRKVDRGVEW